MSIYKDSQGLKDIADSWGLQMDRVYKDAQQIIESIDIDKVNDRFVSHYFDTYGDSEAISKKIGFRSYSQNLDARFDFFNDYNFFERLTDGKITKSEKAEFVEYLKEELLEPNKIKFDFDEWIYQPGIPKNCVKVNSKRFKEMQKLAKEFATGNDIFEPKTTYEPIPKSWRKKRVTKQLKRSDYSTQEWMEFIRSLPKQMDPEKMALADAYMNFSRWGNSEVMTEWYVLAIRSDYKPAFLPMEQFITQVGRRKYLLPIYGALNETPEHRQLALSIFETAKMNYHFVSKSSVESLLGL
jgi:hypothetical protein